MIQANYDHSDHPSSTQHFMLNLILFLCAGIFDIMQEGAFDHLYKWLFRLLSLISISLIIYINYQRAKEYFTKNKN